MTPHIRKGRAHLHGLSFISGIAGLFGLTVEGIGSHCLGGDDFVAHVEARFFYIRLLEDQLRRGEFQDIEGAGHDEDLAVVADFHHPGELDGMFLVIDRVRGLAGFPAHVGKDDQRVFFKFQGRLLDIRNNDRNVSAFAIGTAAGIETIGIHDPGPVKQTGVITRRIIQMTRTRNGQNGQTRRESGKKSLFHLCSVKLYIVSV